MLRTLQPLGIGEITVELPVSKIKVNADLAGLSVLSPLLRVNTPPMTPTDSLPSLRSSSLTAILKMTPVMEVSRKMLLTT